MSRATYYGIIRTMRDELMNDRIIGRNVVDGCWSKRLAIEEATSRAKANPEHAYHVIKVIAVVKKPLNAEYVERCLDENK